MSIVWASYSKPCPVTYAKGVLENAKKCLASNKPGGLDPDALKQLFETIVDNFVLDMHQEYG